MQTFSSHIQYLTLIQSLIMIQLYMYGQPKLNVLKLSFAYINMKIVGYICDPWVGFIYQI